MTGTCTGGDCEDKTLMPSAASSWTITDPRPARVEGLSSSVPVVHGRAVWLSDVLVWYELEDIAVTTVAVRGASDPHDRVLGT